MKPLVLLTRPEGSNDALEAQIAGRGWSVVSHPLLRIEALDEEERSALPVIEAGDRCIFISANAARMGLPFLLESLQASGIECFAVGEKTAEALAQSGLTAQVPSRPDSEGLLALAGLNGIVDQRIILVKGEGGREVLAETLKARGAEVVDFVCYRRVPVREGAGALLEGLASHPGWIAQANSGETLGVLTDLLSDPGGPTLSEGHVVVPSERVAEQARDAGWSRVTVAADASDAAFMTVLDMTVLESLDVTTDETPDTPDKRVENPDAPPAEPESVPESVDAATPEVAAAATMLSAKTPAPEPVTSPPAKPRKSRDWFARFLSVIMLAGAGAGAAYGYLELWPQWLAREGAFADLQRLEQGFAKLSDENAQFSQTLRQELNGKVEQQLVDLDTRVSSARSAFEAAAASSQRDQQEALTQARTDQAELRRQLTERADRADRRLARLTATDRRAWLANEAAFLVRLAAQRLLSAKDVESAAALLVNADDLLLEANDPRFDAARRALAQDRALLREAPQVDMVGLYARFSALADQATALRIVDEDNPVIPVASEETDWLAKAEAGWQAALSRLSDYLVIRSRDAEMAKLMTPEWEALIRQNLRMLIEQAQIASLSGNQPLFEAALTRASAFVREFSGTDPDRSRAMLGEISALAEFQIAPEMPDLIASRTAIRDAIRLMDGDPPAELSESGQ